MGKKNGKGSSAPKGAANASGLPSFDENALSALTAKIEQGFDKPKKPSKNGNKDDRGDKATSGKQEERTKSKPKNDERGSAQGKKRDARGNFKDIDQAGSKKKSAKEPKASAADDRATLLQEILAMGGTEDDLDLVADALSDEEEEQSNDKTSTKISEKDLKKELAQFVAGLGIESQVTEAPSDSEQEAADEEVDEEWEDGSEVNSDDDEEPESSSIQETTVVERSKPAKAAPAAVESKDQTSNTNRLVSLPSKLQSQS
jgi:ribosome biogenesis protein MAK21